MQSCAIGLPWYRPENFLRLRNMCSDGTAFQDTYHDWLSSAQKHYERLLSQGKRVVRTDIDPAKFQIWCDIRGLRMDSHARRSFAAMIAQQLASADIGSDTFQ